MKKSLSTILAAALILAIASIGGAEDAKDNPSMVTITGSGQGTAGAAQPAPATPAAAAPEDSKLSVIESAISTAIKNSSPVGEGDKFPASIGKLYCYTRIAGASGEALVTHKWFLNNKLIDAIVLRVKGNPYRIYSAKTILPYMKGDWRVDVVDENGALLKTLTFKVE